MNLAGLDKLQILEVKRLYKEASEVYRNCPKPANYIPNYIKRRLNFIIETEQIYLIANDLIEAPKCPVCGKDCKFMNLTLGYNKTCSNYCSRRTEEYITRMKIVSSKPNPTKGKTYKEIFGDKPVKCGFQKGDKNIAKRPEVREKISIAVKASYDKNNGELRKIRSEYSLKHQNQNVLNFKKRTVPDSYGNLYRSKLEANFSNILIENKIPFKYEVPIRMSNRHIKWVDFVIDDTLFIEISGYAYERWQDDFDRKMKLFDSDRDLDNSIILILTFGDKLEYMQKRQEDFKNQSVNIFYDDIENKKHWLRGINFYRSILKFNREFKNVYFT